MSSVNTRVRVQVAKALEKGPISQHQLRTVENTAIAGLKIGIMAPDSRFAQKFTKYKFVESVGINGETYYLYIDTDEASREEEQDEDESTATAA